MSVSSLLADTKYVPVKHFFFFKWPNQGNNYIYSVRHKDAGWGCSLNTDLRLSKYLQHSHQNPLERCEDPFSRSSTNLAIKGKISCSTVTFLSSSPVAETPTYPQQ